MGSYLNPGNEKFYRAINSEIYVDKTGLIGYTNKVLNTMQQNLCVSRPRRFGKSMAADMLTAYYSRGCDSKELFQGLKIANDQNFEKYLNKYDTIFLNMQEFLSQSNDIYDMLTLLKKSVLWDLLEEYPDYRYFDNTNLTRTMSDVYKNTKRPFVIIIDEWDCIFREYKNDKDAQEKYLDFLRDTLKDKAYIQLVYMTGILPIKKYGTHSALNMFSEYSMANPRQLAEYVGFTEKEVRGLCQEHALDFNEANKWYDGYRFDKIGHVYSPNSIIEAVINQKFSNYWTQTETYESLRIYIDMDFDGLKKAIIDMLGGQKCRIDTGTFQNDMTSLQGRDDVLTLLVHLGYLAYDDDSGEVYIPNEEVRQEFIRAVKNGKRKELVKAVQLSDRMLEATLSMDCETVAEILEETHDANVSPKFYNNEQALRSVVIMAYLSCIDHYIRFEELASGKGYSDILFLPNADSSKPALLIELKWDKSAQGAISQIKKKNYTQVLQKFTYHGDLLLVGINYNSRTKRHSCKIEKIQIF